MSDITGSTPLPKPVQSVSHGTDKATAVAKDKQQADTQTREENSRDQRKPQQQETVHGRDPAVSISASAAHLHVGEELKQKVSIIDSEGRPIIETGTATFALRPDAGLKVGDDVTLIVKDAGKQVTADLLLRNGAIIDPPIRLNLVVIALHSVEPATPRQEATNSTVTPNYKPSYNFTGPKVTTTAVTETETLARVMARGAPPSYGLPQKTPETDLAQSPNSRNTTNLSALISTQQGAGTVVKQPGDAAQIPALNQQVIGQASAQSNHLIPQSTLTEVTSLATPGTTPTGLGAFIPAISLSGSAVNIQLLDPSVSKVSPAEVASVISVRQLTSQDAKALPVAVAALGNTSALAHVETSKGSFVVSQASTNSLAGELIRISSTQTHPSVPQSTALPTYAARLQGPHAPTASTVQIQLPTANTAANPLQNNTTVSAVHITRAFLTPEGPKSDIRLETALGDISLTLPNNLRPAVGATVAILPPPQVIDSQVAQAVPLAGSAISAVSISQWPSFEQAYDLLQSVAPAGAQAMSARTTQGGPKVANSAMFLLSALGGGNTSSWLGKAAEGALANRNPQLLDLLKDDIGRLFSIAADTSGEWRALLLPFDAKNQDMPMLAFLFGHGSSVDPEQHKQGQQPDENSDDELKRFVLEVQFSVLGSVQLDGSIRGKRFDLMVRSQQQFSPALTQDTSELFSHALAAGAFTGSLGFSVEQAFPVDVSAVLEKMSPDQQRQLT